MTNYVSLQSLQSTMALLILLQKDQFVKGDDVIIEQDTCLPNSELLAAEEEEVEEEEGGQGEYESFFIMSLKLFNIQRLRLSKAPKLKFFLTVTVCTEGVDKEGKVDFEVPLNTHLLNKNN